MTAHATPPPEARMPTRPPAITFPPDPLARIGPPCCKTCGGSLVEARDTKCPHCGREFLPYWPCTYTRAEPDASP